MRNSIFIVAAMLVILGTAPVWAQMSASQLPYDTFASNVIVTQSRAYALDRNAQLRLEKIAVQVEIIGQMAMTTLWLHLDNPSAMRLESELLLPVPDSALVRSFAYNGGKDELTARLLPHDEADRTYHGLVAAIRDPGLLEFAGYNLIRSSVFPVEPHSKQKVRISYEHLLPADGSRIDYVLPRSQALESTVPWEIHLRIKEIKPLATIYSPTHELVVRQPRPGTAEVQVATGETMPSGPLLMSILLENKGMTASLMSYPDPKVGGGYFLLLAGLDAESDLLRESRSVHREVLLVLDKSGSMAGDKLTQVKQATLETIERLEDGESFNLIVFNEAVEFFAAQPVVKSAESLRRAKTWINALQSRGGTNIHDALIEALRRRPTSGALPIVLFLTDGLPTIGTISEKAIREVAEKGNSYKKRVFTFGVGMDVNTPLLSRIAEVTRAKSTFVLSDKDVQAKIGQVFRSLSGPVLTDGSVEILDASGAPVPGRVQEMLPAHLPDLYSGEQLIVLGRYVGEEPLTFQVAGNYFGRGRTFRFDFDPAKATTKNGFVPRLWASRKIGVLIDEIRQAGADGEALAPAQQQELVTEIIKLSTEFGIMTEYTAFLALDGTDLTRWDSNLIELSSNLDERAVRVRSGRESVNQELNYSVMSNQTMLNQANFYYDTNLDRVSVVNVRQVADRAFVKRDNRWVDTRVAVDQSTVKPDRVVEFGSFAYRQLVNELVLENRQSVMVLDGEIIMEINGEVIALRPAK